MKKAGAAHSPWAWRLPDHRRSAKERRRLIVLAIVSTICHIEDADRRYHGCNQMGLREFDTLFEGVPMHCWEGGSGLPLLMLHGSGAGASTMGNFKRVIGPLSERYHVLAADLIGFGQSGRKASKPFFDMDMWLRQAAHMINMLGGGSVGVIGHSLSGSLALKLAAQDERVAAILATGTMGARFEVPNGSRGWMFPETKEQLIQGARNTVFDKSLIDAEEIEYRAKILYAPGYAEYFKAMFSEGRQRYIDLSALTEEEARKVLRPVILMHGQEDAAFTPEQTTLALARVLPQADAYILKNCGHSVALERPEAFMSAANLLFATL